MTLPRPSKLLSYIVQLNVILLPSFTVMISQESRAGTFIGNGGSTQDLDLDAALAVINRGSKIISKDSETLCRCPEQWEETDLCLVVSQLSTAERKACREILSKHANEIEKLSARATPIKFEWSDSPLTAKESASSRRKVDAVSQVSKNKIIINRNRFFNMKLMQRVSLIAHELFHFIKINEKLTDDEAAAPPFKNGRAMLDTLAASLTLETFEYENLNKIAQLELVSRSKKAHWLYLDLGRVHHQEKPSKNLLRSKSSSQFSLSYGWRRDQVGFNLGIDNISYDSRYAREIDITESLRLAGVGLDFRFNPLSAYLSSWNESHIIMGVFGHFGSAEYRAKSEGVSINDSASASAVKSSLKALIPLNNGLWISASAEVRLIQYEYRKLKIKTKETQRTYTMGGAYGF